VPKLFPSDTPENEAFNHRYAKDGVSSFLDTTGPITAARLADMWKADVAALTPILDELAADGVLDVDEVGGVRQYTKLPGDPAPVCHLPSADNHVESGTETAGPRLGLTDEQSDDEVVFILFHCGDDTAGGSPRRSTAASGISTTA
jgi:hypothetical protein